MPLFRRRRMQATINSTKHILNYPVFSVAAAGLTEIVEINSTSVQSVANANDVRSGSVIKAVYIEAWIHSGNDVSAATFTITVEKRKGGQPTMTPAQSLNLMAYPNKANILYTTQGIIGAGNTTNPVPILKQWVAIPKGKQRFAMEDELVVNYHSISVGISVCGVTIYKEYY